MKFALPLNRKGEEYETEANNDFKHLRRFFFDFSWMGFHRHLDYLDINGHRFLSIRVECPGRGCNIAIVSA